MAIDLDTNPATWEGIFTGAIPDEFRDKICSSHGGAGWTRNPLDVEANNEKDEYIWVCGSCKKPTRVALVNCLGCEQWFFDMRLSAVSTRPGRRDNYFCEDCLG